MKTPLSSAPCFSVPRQSGFCFSVIVPTYRRPAALKRCLEALSQLNYPRDRFEVIVVNDGDRTLPKSIVASYQTSLNIQLLFQENTGPAGARNAGALRAKGTFLAFTDDDCMVAPDWLSVLKKHWRAIANNPALNSDHALGGNTINALANNLYATASQLHGDAVYAYFNRAPGDSTFFAACNFSVPRQAYLQIGGFDERFPIAAGEDREFCDRWLRQSYAMTYLPAARVYHAHALSLGSFLKQHFNYGRGAFFFHQSRAQAIEQKAAAPVKTDLKFYWHLITYPFQSVASKTKPWPQALLLCGLFITCNIAKTVGFFWERLRDLFLATAFERFSARRTESVRLAD